MPVTTRKTLFQRQIPTAFGLVFLVVALISGLLLFSDGTGYFSPRAAPETTPQNVKITNVRDDSFTVSFMTTSQTVGYIKYGTDANSLKLQAADERDELTGTVGKYAMHHVVVRDLKPKTPYFFEVGTGANTNFTNGGQPFSTTTTAALNVPQPVSKTIYGSVKTTSGTPAEGSVVYITAPGVGELSALVKASGSWAISLAQARSADGSAYASVKDDTMLAIIAQGITPTQKSSVQVAVSEAQPVADLFLGQTTASGGSGASGVSLTTANGTASTAPTPTVEYGFPTQSPDGEPIQDDTMKPTSTPTPSPTRAVLPPSYLTVTPTKAIMPPVTITATPTASASSGATDPVVIVDLTRDPATADKQTVRTTAPLIRAKAAPRVKVKVTIHSETQIDHTTTADSAGNFEVDLETLGQDLEPGEHTVSYEYEDPDTGETVTKNYTFYVSGSSGQIAQANTNQYSSGNPYPITSPTPTKKLTPTPTTDPTASSSGELDDTSTRSAVVSTEDGTYTAGSMSATWLLVFGGMFFILTGIWSWWLANQAEAGLIAEDQE